MLLQEIIPKQIEDFTLHSELINNILNFSNEALVHSIFFGNYGYGKTTLAKLMIANHLKIQPLHLYKKTFFIFNHKDETFNILKSNYHYEINIQHYTKQQQDMIPELILDLSNTTDIHTHKYKIVILKNAEFLSRNIQHQLRRMMESYNKTCRIIFITHNLSNIDETIQSRCVKIAIPKPNKNNIITLIEPFINSHKLTIDIDHLIEECDYNLNKIMIQLFSLKINPTITNNNIITNYSNELWNIINKKKININELKKILNDITTTCINIYDIINNFTQKIIEKSNTITYEKILYICKTINYYMYLYEIGNKKTFQVECMLVKINLIIKNNQSTDYFLI